MNLLPENEATEFENRTYVNPQLVVDEGESFIDKLRSTQQANNQQIKTQTYNLGRAVPSNLGGLVGGEGYWTSRYQTPQTNTLVNDLRAANRATALNQAMENDIAVWKKRYEDAKKAYELSSKGGGGGGGSKDPQDETKGDVENEDPTKKIADMEVLEGDYDENTPIAPLPAESYGNMFFTHDLGIGRSAGMSEFLDKFTEKYNYTLPNGLELEEGGTQEQLVRGSDGNFYIEHKEKVNGQDVYTYAPIRGDKGSTTGGSRWWR